MTLGGWVADAAVTLPIGQIDADRERLLAATERRCWRASPRPLPATGWATSPRRSSVSARRADLSVVRSLVGHGVGREMHEDPQVPNYGRPGRGVRLEEGMVIAIEPMTTLGGPGVHVGDDGWAIFAQDDSPTAHFEFTVAITADGPRILRRGTFRPPSVRASLPLRPIDDAPIRCCYYPVSCPRVVGFDLPRVCPRPGSGGRTGSQSRVGRKSCRKGS